MLETLFGMRRPLLMLATLLVVAGCGARFVKFEEKGITCTEAQNLAIKAVRKMGYTVDETMKPLPGTPGVIRASRMMGTSRQGMFVQVFCTVLGAEVEAKTEDGSLAQLNFASDFRRAYEAAVASKPPERAPAAEGLDVTITSERGSGSAALPVDLTNQGIFPTNVRISNNTSRTYSLRIRDVILNTTSGEKVKPLPLDKVTQGLEAQAAATVRGKALGDSQIPAHAVVSGFLFYPMQPYTRARVTLTDTADGEPEGFSINF